MLSSPTAPQLKLFVKRLSPTAVMPTRATDGSAGYDLSAAHAVVVPAQGKAIIPTDLAIALPDRCYGRLAPRSGLSWKTHTDVAAGVIDRDYRGNVGVILFNHSEKDLHGALLISMARSSCWSDVFISGWAVEVAPGDRVAQLILERYEIAEVLEVKELDDTYSKPTLPLRCQSFLLTSDFHFLVSVWSARGSGGFGSTGVGANASEAKRPSIKPSTSESLPLASSILAPTQSLSLVPSLSGSSLRVHHVALPTFTSASSSLTLTSSVSSSLPSLAPTALLPLVPSLSGSSLRVQHLSSPTTHQLSPSRGPTFRLSVEDEFRMSWGRMDPMDRQMWLGHEIPSGDSGLELAVTRWKKMKLAPQEASPP